ncbi:MAG: RusA family crossover junction endodeoxyribonuclease [Patescibacteria group bacterium]|nr:RusA family crossover junction endodeoxyribonuclease [Patescibacteria group bacterium]
MIELNLPYPPTANHIWIRARKGMRKSDEYERWLRDAGFIALAQKPGRLQGPYKLSIQIRRPDRRRRDLDNAIKPISDLLASVGIIENDCLCEMLSARWVTNGEGVTVRIEPAGVE